MKTGVRFLVLSLVLILAASLTACGPIHCGNDLNDDCLRVLFVGNSLTFVNDLPTTFSELARSGGHKVEVAMVVEGGAHLYDFVSSPELSNTLSSSQWDYVVLQEQSQLPSVEYWRVNDMYPAARTLVKKVRANDAQPIFFETWGREYGFPENGMPDFESMQYEIDMGYQRIANELNAPIAHVGMVWFRALRSNPDLQLWQEDGNHPSEMGTYLAACVFYATLFQESPLGLAYPGNISKEVALKLQEAAATVLIK